MVSCTIDFNVNDRLSSIRAMIDRLAPLWAAAPGEDIEVDLSRSHYLGPDAAAVLGALFMNARLQGRQLRVHLPKEPPPLAAFCEFSGLQYLLFGSHPPDTMHPDCVTVPLRQLDRARHDDVEPIFRLIRAYAQLSEEVEFALGVAFSEVIQNVEDHARSPVGAVTCARYMTGRQEVRVAIVDLGDGIGTTLRRRYADTRDATHGLQRVLEGGYLRPIATEQHGSRR